MELASKKMNGLWLLTQETGSQQFLQFDPEQEEAQVYFLIRSTSSTKWFVWPELCGKKPDIAWIDEGIFDSHLIFSL